MPCFSTCQRPFQQGGVAGKIAQTPQPHRLPGGRDTHHVREIAGPKASADRQLNAPLEAAFLPLVFHPLDRNVRMAFLLSPAATSPAERHLRDNNTFRLHGRSGGCHNRWVLVLASVRRLGARQRALAPKERQRNLSISAAGAQKEKPQRL